MKKVIDKTTWWIFGGVSILVGLYPIIYFLIDRNFGLLSSKSQELLSDQLWNIGFYGHIIPGGIALLIGWTQFSTKLRKTRLNWHRTIGKIYVITVLISGICGIYIGFFATGGLVSVIGFVTLGVIWISSTLLAFNAIKNRKLAAHENYMIISYAACFAAVMLRIWLPILTSITGDFISAYQIVAWLSWMPNLLVAYYIINRKKRKTAISIG